MTQRNLYLLGSPRLEIDGDICEPDTRKATALLAYLALTGERLSRDALAAFLWPELDEKRAKAALRRTLSSLKSTIGGEPLYASREQIGIEPQKLWVDVAAFSEAIETDNLETAVSLYRDSFMAGFSLRDAVSFDDWQRQQAAALQRELDGALAQLVARSLDQQAFDSGLTYAHRWVEIDPLREEAHSQLMRLYAQLGQRPKALQQYRTCVRILDEELGVPPLPETTDLYQEIQADQLTRPSEAPTPIPTPAAPAQTAVLPFIGRQAELDRIQAVYQQVGPDGRFLIIEGEPGIGKTRLAEAIVQSARQAGATVLTARGYEGETNLAYAPILQLLQDGIAGDQTGKLETLAAHHLAEAARLLPQLASGRSLPPLPDLDAPGAQVRFYDSVAHLLNVLLTGPTPGILWLDDAHWLDAASQELLLFLLHRWEKRPFLILLCWRQADLSPNNPLASLAVAQQRTGLSTITRLHRFTQQEVNALLDASGIPFAPELPQRLYQESEGLPFFVVEYLHTLQNQTAVSPNEQLPTPASVRDLLHQRLRQIGETERQIVQTAATIGRSFDLNFVQAASGRSPEETVTALEQLTARGLLLEQTAVYDFSHDKLRTLVYEEMGLARRRLLHRRLAETLVNRRTTPTTALLAEIATHYQLAGLEADAAVYFVQAGNQAQKLYARQDALRYFQAALALGADEAWRLHIACGDMNLRLGQYPDALTSYETAAALAPAAELARVEHKLAQVYQRQGEWRLAATTLSQAQAHSSETADPAFLAHLLIDRSLVANRRQQPNAALALAEEARELARQAADETVLAYAMNLLGLLARGRGEFETAVGLLEQSRQLADQQKRLDIQVASRNNLALALGTLAQLPEAKEQLEEALALCQQLGDRHHEAALHSNLADVLHQLGEETAAQESVRRSVMIYAEIGREESTWRAEIWRLMEW